MRNAFVTALAVVFLAVPATAQEPNLDQLYAHCEKTLDEGTAAADYERQRADSLEKCLLQARNAYGLAAKDAVLTTCH